MSQLSEWIWIFTFSGLGFVIGCLFMSLLFIARGKDGDWYEEYTDEGIHHVKVTKTPKALSEQGD